MRWYSIITEVCGFCIYHNPTGPPWWFCQQYYSFKPVNQNSSELTRISDFDYVKSTPTISIKRQEKII